MCRKYFTEIVIILLLSHVGWNGPSTTIISCPRDKSRVVKNIIQKKILPILEKYRVPLPLDCPFHSERDVLWWPDEANSNDREWTCPVCGQKFLCEDGLETHWDRIHTTLTNKIYVQHEDAVCLANFCDIMRCEVLQARMLKKKHDWHMQEFTKDKDHYPHKVIPTKENSLAETRKHKECDREQLIQLQHKCRAVIRQCIMGLLATLSLQDFLDIEEEINKATCFYLTCERFWDDSLQEIRHIPTLFCIIVGTIMVGGFCLCYYIVWVLFDSPTQDSLSTVRLLSLKRRYSDSHSIFPSYHYHRLSQEPLVEQEPIERDHT
ncbi:uncharacterized protein LOC143230907 isoform X1 [Tachypleus tridentatus]|uniref:uncharacterized protein LOC143230907 isoform X1 n=1 Tax=Tachypleus tridentatus TaxID=6853 RepID=UPI003FD60807